MSSRRGTVSGLGNVREMSFLMVVTLVSHVPCAIVRRVAIPGYGREIMTRILPFNHLLILSTCQNLPKISIRNMTFKDSLSIGQKFLTRDPDFRKQPDTHTYFTRYRPISWSSFYVTDFPPVFRLIGRLRRFVGVLLPKSVLGQYRRKIYN